MPASKRTDFASAVVGTKPRADFGPGFVAFDRLSEVRIPRLDEELFVRLDDRLDPSERLGVKPVVRREFDRLQLKLGFRRARSTRNMRRFSSFVAKKKKRNRPTRNTVGIRGELSKEGDSGQLYIPGHSYRYRFEFGTAAVGLP